MTKIGPTFLAEMLAAGVTQFPAWNADTGRLIFPVDASGNQTVSSDQQALIRQVLAAHDPTKTPPPEEISDRQFFQQLAIAGKITQDEALAYVAAGTLPASMTALLGQLPADQQFAAKMAVIGAHSFLRSNPLTTQLGTLYGMSAADLDALWIAASAL